MCRELRHPAARWGFGALACALALAGDLDGAEDAFAELDAEPSTPVQLFDPEIARGRAWVAAQRGERTRARELLIAAADEAEAGGALAIAAGAVHDLARLGEARLAAERLAVIEPADRRGSTSRRAAPTPTRSAPSDADRLDRVSERFEVLRRGAGRLRGARRGRDPAQPGRDAAQGDRVGAARRRAPRRVRGGPPVRCHRRTSPACR